MFKNNDIELKGIEGYGLWIVMMVGEDGDLYLVEGFNVEDEVFESWVYCFF